MLNKLLQPAKAVIQEQFQKLFLGLTEKYNTLNAFYFTHTDKFVWTTITSPF
jgi:hypothetical protein